MGKLRKLPYGANYLDWNDMVELREAIDEKILFRFQTVQESRATRLERVASERFGTKHALAVHNCTEGLRLSLLGTQPKIGDIVYIPAVTFVAVAGAALSVGLIPVLVDVNEDFLLDPAQLPQGAERVIVAHMEGAVGPLPTGVPFLIEDAAQALGGSHPDGRAAGSVGFTGVFSFHHNKVLTSGEGGLVITNDSERYELMRHYHDHGAIRVQGEYPRWDKNAFFGENFVASEPIASIQLQQFRHLDTLKQGLERGYGILLEHLPQSPDYRIHRRRPGDMKISIRLEFETKELRRRVEERFTAEGLPFWTLERYFLPEHPVLLHRRSIYADGFPWNLWKGEHQPEKFAKTKDRLHRVLCLTISPEVSEEQQVAEARAYRDALGRV